MAQEVTLLWSPLPCSQLDFSIWQMLCSLWPYSLPMQSTLNSLNWTDSSRGRGTAVQWFPDEGVPAGFGPSYSWNMSKVVKGLHSWHHVCGHSLWEGRFWGQGIFQWGQKSCLICQFSCKLRCTTIYKTEDGLRTRKKQKESFLLYWQSLDQACCTWPDWCLKLQNS